MNFPVMMAPWFAAAGVAAVGLAVWMHLYRRVASRRVPISSLRLAPETPRVARSRRQIRHWPLFMLRALGVLLLGAAFARPGLLEGDRRPAAGRETVVFVLDRSGSMAMRSFEGLSAWEEARKRLRSRLAELHPQSRVRLFCFPPAETGEDWISPSAMRKMVAGLTPSLSEGRPLDALHQAAEALARFRSDMPESLEVVGDLQRLGWEQVDTLTLPEELRVRVVQVGDRDEEVSPADERTTLERFVQHHKLEHPVFVMPKKSDMRRDYGARGFPHVVLIGRDGIVRLVKTGASETIAGQIHAKIKELIEAEPVGSEIAATAKSDGPTFRQDPDDPLVWEAGWNLPEPDDIVYRLAIADRHGNLVRNDKPWCIDVLSDEAPKVQIRRRLGDEVITTGKETVQFDLNAVDDVRLAAIRLVYRKPGSPHTRREIELPPDAVRTWSGTELLDLAPLDLRPFDMVAVHAEAEDGNLIDGPGVGHSEVVFLEVPLPASNDAGGEGGGGGEFGGGTPPINPLVLQMEILRSTMVLPDDAPAQERASIAHDQRQNAAYTYMIKEQVASVGASDLEAALGKAQAAMESAVGLLDPHRPQWRFRMRRLRSGS